MSALPADGERAADQMSYADFQRISVRTVVNGQVNGDLRDLHIAHDAVRADRQKIIVILRSERLTVAREDVFHGQRSRCKGGVICLRSREHFLDAVILQRFNSLRVFGKDRALVLLGEEVADQRVKRDAKRYHAQEDAEQEHKRYTFSFHLISSCKARERPIDLSLKVWISGTSSWSGGP